MQRNLDYKKFVMGPRLEYFKPHSRRVQRTFAEEIRQGLASEPRSISPKFFYDLRGSELFEAICGLPEYYPARTEISMLEDNRDDLSKYLDAGCSLVELGSGASVKTRIVLDMMEKSHQTMEYFPIDISDILTESSGRLLALYETLHITGIIDSYEGGLEFLKRFDRGNKLILFLGSSYGNFTPSQGMEFLRRVHSAMRPGDLFLLGLDMVKDTAVLESAYNDSQGLTAEFNLNVLSRINSELDADFDLDNFEHHAIYNPDRQRIEMYARSLANQTVTLSGAGMQFRLHRGELIGTEHSYKFRPEQIRDLVRDAGFDMVSMWHDEKRYFSHTLISIS